MNPTSRDALGDRLTRIVGATHVLRDPALTAPFETDWTRRYTGRAALVVRPGDTDEVAAVLRACADAGVAVVPQGGNTGLVGGSIPSDGEVVLSLTRLDRLDDVDEQALQVTVGAGATLATVQAHARAAGLVYPVDLAARDSATIGGTIATNAGGIHVIRYGATRAQVVGIEAVTADGQILRRMSGLVKDNAGYDLAGLLTGSEGTLAVITAARLRLVQPSPERVVAVVATADLAAAQRVLAGVRSRLDTLEAVEFFLADGLALVREVTGVAPPFATSYPAYLLIECAGRTDPTEALAAAIEDAADIEDVAVATDAPGRARLWALREHHTDAINARGVPVKLDVSLPAAALAPFAAQVPDVVAAVAPGATTILFGHLGDGNLHVNVLGADPGSDVVDDAVLRLTTELGGSISAEHGIGRAKLPWLGLHRDAADIAAMRRIKDALDPDGRLNPHVLLPPRDRITLTRLRATEPYRDRLAADVRTGLMGPERSLPPIHLYDARGSVLFEQITELDEYYPTRTELGILDDHLDELLAVVAPDEVVEIGSGSARKAALLVAAMRRNGATRYVPFDISASALVAAAEHLADAHPWLEVDPHLGDFHLDLAVIPRRGRRLVAFLGSTIGNLAPDERAQLLADIAAMLGPDGGLLLGIDLVKSVDVLEAAYDDAAGVTAAFNSNVLEVINRELDGDIPVDAFAHRAVWDPVAEAIEMHLVATRDVRAHIAGVGLDLVMGSGEFILTEHSHKFRLESFGAELAAAGLALTEVVTDAQERFAVVLARPAAPDGA